MAWRIGAMCVATVLLWQAGAAVAEGWRMAPLAAYVHAAWWGRGVPPDLAAVLAVPPSRPDGRAWSAYAQAALAVAEDRGNAAAPALDLDRAEVATRRALGLGPAQAATWARLALIAVNRGNADLAAAALGRSFVLAPNGSALAWPRVKLGLYLWDGLGANTRASVNRDLVRVWRQPPSEALPYPQKALNRYAALLGRTDLLAALMAQAGGDAG